MVWQRGRSFGKSDACSVPGVAALRGITVPPRAESVAVLASGSCAAVPSAVGYVPTMRVWNRHVGTGERPLVLASRYISGSSLPCSQAPTRIERNDPAQANVPPRGEGLRSSSSSLRGKDLDESAISDEKQPVHAPCRVSTVVVQRFCKPKVGGSNPSPGTMTLTMHPNNR